MIKGKIHSIYHVVHFTVEFNLVIIIHKKSLVQTDPVSCS